MLTFLHSSSSLSKIVLSSSSSVTACECRVTFIGLLPSFLYMSTLETFSISSSNLLDPPPVSFSPSYLWLHLQRDILLLDFIYYHPSQRGIMDPQGRTWHGGQAMHVVRKFMTWRHYPKCPIESYSFANSRESQYSKIMLMWSKPETLDDRNDDSEKKLPIRSVKSLSSTAAKLVAFRQIW